MMIMPGYADVTDVAMLTASWFDEFTGSTHHVRIECDSIEWKHFQMVCVVLRRDDSRVGSCEDE